ncbi:MAG TPA: FtsX-like permease family protein [Clostridia bacterium]|nr:FtsX-like permease family protein [Clostridia bacterium]
MRGIWAAAFLLRRLRSERGVVLLVVALVGVTSFLVAGAPRLYNLVADAGLRRDVADASAARRNIELAQEFAIPPLEDPPDVLDRNARTYRAQMAESVRSLIEREELVATSPRFGVRQPPRYTTFISLRHQTGLDGEVELAEGRWPAATGERLPGAATEFGPPATEPPEVPPRIEIAISEATAAESGLAVGQVLESAIDSSDPLLPAALVRPLVAQIEIVGVFRVLDPAADVWYSDNRLLQVSAQWNDDDPIVFATGLVAPETHPDLVTSNLPFRYEWHFFIDPERLDAGRLESLLPDLRRLETTFTTSALGGPDPERVVLRSSLLPIVERYLAQRAASEAVLSVAAIGPLALAAGAIGMLAVLLIARRRSALAIARSRGASTGLILGAQVWEGVLFAGAAAVAGLVAATIVVPGRASVLSVVLSIGTAAVAVALLVAATWPAVRRPLEPGGRDETPPVKLAPRRLVLELTAVGLAVAGILLLQQRGLTIDEGGRQVVRFDPFLAAVPVLAGLAAGIVATRLYPLPVRAVGWLAARRRDLVPVLGLRSVGRRPSFATLPLLVLMLAAAFGAFALVVTSSIERGQLDASWREVGADYRIESVAGSSLAEIDPGSIAGVEAIAAGYRDPGAALDIGSGRRARIPFAAIDARAHAVLVAGSPVALAWPAEFDASPGLADGSEDAPIPAIASRTPPSAVDSMTSGDTVRVRVAGATLTLRIVATSAGLPGIVEGETFLVVPLEPLRAAAAPLEPNVLFVRGPASAGAELGRLVASAAPAGSTVLSRHAWFGELRASPLIAVVGDGFRLALGVAAVYAALAVIIALTLTATNRTRDLAFLRTLGMSSRQAVGVTLVEHGIPVLLALVPGVATGIAVALLLESSLGLDAFMGSGTAYRVRLDWSGIAGVALALAGVVAVAIVASTWLARRAPAVDALRAGEA